MIKPLMANIRCDVQSVRAIIAMDIAKHPLNRASASTAQSNIGSATDGETLRPCMLSSARSKGSGMNKAFHKTTEMDL